MTDSGVMPRDDRTWPRWARTFSVLVVLIALAVAGWAVATAADGEVPAAVVAGAFVLMLAASIWLFRATFVAVIAGRGASGVSQLLQLALVVVCLAAGAYNGRLGAAGFSGVFAGMFGVNLWAIRRARGNRQAVDAAAAARAGAGPSTAPPTEVPRGDRSAVDVGGALDVAWRDAGQRWLAWVVAGGVVTVGVRLGTDSDLAHFMVPFMTTAVVLWLTRSLWTVWRARRDFAAARTPAERAWVVLLSDPTPRMIRPLLGLWSEPPLVEGGPFPRPELVMRCDDGFEDLLSHQGAVVVHEAWVDTSSHGFRGSRWVAADAGIALPHRRALFGRWYFGSLTRGERPGPPEPLRTARPEPGEPRDPSAAGSGAGGSGGFARRLAWRTGILAALAGVLVLID